MLSNRWRNYGLWLGLASLVPLLLQAFGVDVLPPQLEAYKQLVNGLLGLLAGAGIISNPTTLNPGFKDDTPNTIREQINAEKHS